MNNKCLLSSNTSLKSASIQFSILCESTYDDNSGNHVVDAGYNRTLGSCSPKKQQLSDGTTVEIISLWTNSIDSNYIGNTFEYDSSRNIIAITLKNLTTNSIIINNEPAVKYLSYYRYWKNRASNRFFGESNDGKRFLMQLEIVFE